MKVVKLHRVAVPTRAYEALRELRLGVSLRLFVPLGGQPALLPILRGQGSERPGGRHAEADLPFEVGPGKKHVWELAYNSGRVTFKTFQFEGGPSIQSIFSIQTEAGTAAGGALSRSQPDFELLAGKYELSVALGNIKLTRSFAVQPGSDESQNISLNVGKVQLRAVASPGGGCWATTIEACSRSLQTAPSAQLRAPIATAGTRSSSYRQATMSLASRSMAAGRVSYASR